MKYAYLDTSALLAYLLEDSGSFERHSKNYNFVSSDLIVSETLSTLRREKRMPEFPGFTWSYTSLLVPSFNRPQYSNTILQKGYLRGADLHHLSTALFFFEGESKNKYLLSLDKDQVQVGQKLGFQILR